MANYDVFISYATRDYMFDDGRVIPGNIISRIQKTLTDAGITYWIDEEGLTCGDTFPIEIAKHIENSKVFLLISTEKANQSEWILNEVATARNFNKKIIPFRYDASPYNTGIMIYVAGLQYINYQDNQETALPKLVRAIQKALREEPEDAKSIELRPMKWYRNKHVLIPISTAIGGILVGVGLFFAIPWIKQQHISKNDVVYITNHGECYHLDENCRGINGRKVRTITFEEAQTMDRRPCTICAK